MYRRTTKTLKIVQHNVLKWTYSRSLELANYYRMENPDIILLNATGIEDEKRIKIFGYNTIQRNYAGEQHAGVAILVKKNIEFKTYDHYRDDILAVSIETPRGPVLIATLYSPPRRAYLPLGEVRSILQRNIPAFLIGDLNATHQSFGYTNGNFKGKEIVNLINRMCRTFGSRV